MAKLKQEAIKQSEGFGNDSKLTKGEYYRSSGFFKSQNGLVAGGYLGHIMNFYSLTDLGDSNTMGLAYARGFAFSTQNPSNYLYASGQNGEFIQTPNASAGSSEYVHRAMSTNHAYFNHTITDPKGRLLYHQDQYLGMFDGTGSTTNYITGTVTVTNGANTIVGSGTTFTAGMVGKAIRIAGDTKFYLIGTFTDATHITFSGLYTGTGGGGKSYLINTQWNDQWKNFGAVVTLPNGNVPKCPMDIYEDTVIFGRGNVVCTLNVTTDTITTDAVPSLNLPAGYSVEQVVSNSNGILIGGNVRSKGFALLWDNLSDRAIAPWIWFDDSVLSICKNGSNWIITTTRAVYTSNGYSAEVLTTNLLDSSYSAFMNGAPKSSVVIDNALHFFGYGSNRTLRRNVLYRMNLTSKIVEAFPRYTLNQYSPSLGQMEYVGEFNRLCLGMNGVAHETGIDMLQLSDAPVCSTFITSLVGSGDDKKVAKRIKIRLHRNTSRISGVSDTFSFKIAVKISDKKHTNYGFSQTKITSADTTHITVNNGVGSFKTPSVGDEVEFVGDSGNDTNAGYARNVTAVTGAGTSTEVWTVDSAFPSIPQISQNVTITPFQLVGRKTVSVTNGEIEELIFDVKNSIKANKYMIKVDIEANTSGVQLEMEQPIFIYEDMGVL